MTSIVLLLLGIGFALLAWSGWRSRASSDPSSSVEGFARVLAAIDPDAPRAPLTPEAIDVIDLDEHVPDFR